MVHRQLELRESEDSVTLRVRVRPRASRDEVQGVHDGALLVRLTAKPVDGEANAALARLLAHELRVPATAIELMRGQTGRDKLLRVRGLAAEVVRARLVPREVR
jgi:uncharacterized protein